MYSVILTVILLASIPLMASQITTNQAKKVAHNFYYERFNQGQHLNYSDVFIEDLYSVKEGVLDVIYFVNFKNNGWVAISASDAVVPILAYSFVSNFEKSGFPENVSLWISQYKKQIQYDIQQNSEATESTNSLWTKYLTDTPDEFKNFSVGRSIEPLTTTTWDQGLFYNEMCPSDPGGPGGHCYVGCVPVTMGQVCNYYGFPQTGTGSYSYQCPPYGELSADFENTEYIWDEMPGFVSGNSVPIATLLYHLGVSCDLVYGPSGSGMYNHKAAYSLRTHFKYSPETGYVFRDSTNLNWDSLLIAHLDRKMPMYYAGWSVPDTNGHAFVCDGYQDSSYFHFNWGWGGSYDGYFYTSDLGPGGNNFNLAQEVIINCFPDTVNNQYPYYCQGADTLRSTAGAFNDGSGPIYSYINNQSCSWLISPNDSVVYINLEFKKFDIHESDTLYVYDGNDETSVLLGSFSGNELPSNIKSSNDELFLKFETSSDNVSEGWLIEYSSSIPQYCSNMVMTEPFDTISDGSGTANYQNLTTCLWLIQPGAGMDVTLSFMEFNTEDIFDIVKVYDGSEKLGEFSGNELPPDLTAHSGLMSVFFSTNLSVTNTGWKASYITTPVGTSKQEMNDIVKIFPNPANDVLNIELSEIQLYTEVYIYDLLGRKVRSSEMINSRSIRVVTSDLTNGIYFVKVSYLDNSITKKVVIR